MSVMVKSHVSNLILLESYQAADNLIHTQTKIFAWFLIFLFYLEGSTPKMDRPEPWTKTAGEKLS